MSSEFLISEIPGVRIIDRSDNPNYKLNRAIENKNDIPKIPHIFNNHEI